MYVRQSDLFVSAAILIYIVFFALSPPEFVRTILTSPIGMSASFGVAVYVALYHSKAIGGLLIVALLASMTQVTEHLTAGCSAGSIMYQVVVKGGDLATIPNVADASACGTACCGNASCTGYTYNSQNKNCHLKSGAITTEPALSMFSGATVTRTSATPASQASPPSVDRPASGGSTAATPPSAASAPAPAAAPKPTMSCNLENFAAY